MSQKIEFLKRLEAGETITPLEALNEFGCMRLAARKNELEKDGYQIDTIPVHTATGKTVAGYRLKRIIEPSGQVLLTI